MGTTLDKKFIGSIDKHSLVALWKPINFFEMEGGIVIEKHRHILAELIQPTNEIYTQCLYLNCQSYLNVTNFIRKHFGGDYKCIKNHVNKIIVFQEGENSTF